MRIHHQIFFLAKGLALNMQLGKVNKKKEIKGGKKTSEAINTSTS